MIIPLPSTDQKETTKYLLLNGFIFLYVLTFAISLSLRPLHASLVIIPSFIYQASLLLVRFRLELDLIQVWEASFYSVMTIITIIILIFTSQGQD